MISSIRLSSFELKKNRWWARYFAAIRRAEAFGLEDLVRALGVVDAGAGRIPILGSRAERLRLRFLQANQGIASLVERYSPWPVH